MDHGLPIVGELRQRVRIGQECLDHGAVVEFERIPDLFPAPSAELLPVVSDRHHHRIERQRLEIGIDAHRHLQESEKIIPQIHKRHQVGKLRWRLKHVRNVRRGPKVANQHHLAVEREVEIVPDRRNVLRQIRPIQLLRRRRGLDRLLHLLIQHVEAELLERRQRVRLHFRCRRNHLDPGRLVARQRLGHARDLVDVDVILAHPQIPVVVLLRIVDHFLDQRVARVDIAPDVHRHSQQPMLERQVVGHIDRQRMELIELVHQ